MKLKDTIEIQEMFSNRKTPIDINEITYYSRSKGESIPIGDMDVIHIARALAKSSIENEQLRSENKRLRKFIEDMISNLKKVVDCE